jgi:hypothetical protein
LGMERRRVDSRAIQISISLIVGLGIGILVGRGTAPSGIVDPSSVPPGNSSSPGLGDVAKLVGKARKAIESDGGAGLGAVGDILGNASVGDLIDWGRAPENVSRRIINEMSDDELRNLQRVIQRQIMYLNQLQKMHCEQTGRDFVISGPLDKEPK